MVSGRSRSGKTSRVASILRAIQRYFHIDHTILLSPTAGQPIWQRLEPYLDEVHTKLWAEDEEDQTNIIDKILQQQATDEHKDRRVLLVIDDFAAERSLNEGRKGTFAELVNNARWRNISVIGIGQAITSWSASFRENAEAIIFFPTLNIHEVQYMLEERNPYHDKKKMLAAIQAAQHGSPHNFLFQTSTELGTRHFRNFDYELRETKEQ